MNTMLVRSSRRRSKRRAARQVCFSRQRNKRDVSLKSRAESFTGRGRLRGVLKFTPRLRPGLNIRYFCRGTYMRALAVENPNGKEVEGIFLVG